jgi:hypothetical protein
MEIGNDKTMEKNQLVGIIQQFFAYFEEYAKAEIQSFLSGQDPRILSNFILQNSEKLVQKWFKYLIVDQVSPNGDSFSSGIRYQYNFQSYTLRMLISKVIQDSRFQANFVCLEKEQWLPKFALYFRNPLRYRFTSLIIALILDFFSFETGYVTVSNLKSWNFKILPKQNQQIATVVDYLLGDYVEIEVYYFIFGIELKKIPEMFDPELQITIEKILPQEIEVLTKKLKIGVPFEDSSSKLWNLSPSFFIISRKLKINRDKFQEKNKLHVFKELSIYPANHLEQAFHLLGCSETKIKGYSQTNPFELWNYDFDFLPDGFVQHYGTRNLKEWDFSDIKTLRSMKNTLECTSDVLLFLKEFPKALLNLSQLSLLSNIFHRHRRLHSATFFYDIILESMIILDAVLIEGKQQLGYQIRMKAPWLLSENPSDRLIWKNIVKLLYGIRSQIVHEASTSSGGKKIKKFGDYRTAASYAREIVRGILLQIIQIGSGEVILKDIKQLRTELEHAGLGIKLKISPSSLFQQFSQNKLLELVQKFEKT